MNSVEQFTVSILIIAGAFTGFVALAALAMALPQPIGRFGLLLPGAWAVLVILNSKSLPERLWAIWLKVRRGP